MKWREVEDGKEFWLSLGWQAIKKGVDFLLFMDTLEQADKLTQKGKKNLSLIVTLSTNEWNGVVKPQGKIKQFEVSNVEDKDESEERWMDDFWWNLIIGLYKI